MYYLGFLCYGIGVIALLQGSWEGIAVAVGFAALGTFLWTARTRLDKTSLDDLNREMKEGTSRNPAAMMDIHIGGKHLIITKDEISWRGKRIRTSQVSGIRARNEQINVNLVDLSQRQIRLTGSFGSMTIDCGWGAGVEVRARVLFERVMAAIWPAVCVPLLMQWQQRLSEGQAITVGSLTVVAGGLMLHGGFAGFKPVFTPWTDLKCSAKNGYVTLSSSTSNATGYLKIWRVDNAILVPALIKAAQSLGQRDRQPGA
jgi:hypothetical protein